MLSKKPFFYYLFIQAAIWVSIWARGWTKTWLALGIPSPESPFGDMRAVQASVASARRGLNPQVANGSFAKMDYPKIWIEIAKFLHLDSNVNFYAFVGLYEIAFTLFCALILWRYSSYYILSLCLSTSVLLGIERGNNDLFAFDLLGAVAFVGIPIFFGCVIFASILKIYPFSALAVIPFGGFRMSQTKTLSASFITLLTLISWIKQIPTISRGNSATSGGHLTYGILVISKLTKNWTLLSRFALFLLISAILVLLLSVIVSKFNFDPIFQTDKESELLFLTGAVIFISTFLATENWDYRLIYLIMCAPFLLKLENKLLRIIVFGTLIITMNSILIIKIVPTVYLRNLIEMGTKLMAFNEVLFLTLVIVFPNFVAASNRTMKKCFASLARRHGLT